MSASALLEGLASLPMPVAIVGAAHGQSRSCHTGTLTYATYKPPAIATPLARTSRTWELIEASGELSISILDETQDDLAVLAARSARSEDKFAEHGVPLLEPPRRDSHPPSREPQPCSGAPFWRRSPSATMCSA